MEDPAEPEIDTSRPHAARVYDYFLGGENHFTADREMAEKIAQNMPSYVDNDPLVLAHARALLTSAPEGRTAYIHADLREPRAILADPATHDTLDLSRPVALVMLSTLHLVPDEDKPAEVLATLIGAPVGPAEGRRRRRDLAVRAVRRDGHGYTLFSKAGECHSGRAG